MRQAAAVLATSSCLLLRCGRGDDARAARWQRSSSRATKNMGAVLGVRTSRSSPIAFSSVASAPASTDEELRSWDMPPGSPSVAPRERGLLALSGPLAAAAAEHHSGGTSRLELKRPVVA
jgi:hypothetical protein